MPDLAPIHHVKIPVSDVRVSSEWYLRALGLDVLDGAREHQGERALPRGEARLVGVHRLEVRSGDDERLADGVLQSAQDLGAVHGPLRASRSILSILPRGRGRMAG